MTEEEFTPDSEILVIGSLNIDQTYRVDNLPQAGQTLHAEGCFTSFGGKGANQALAARRTGHEVSMIGCVGDDAHGEKYKERFTQEGIQCEAIFTSEKSPTGSAFITLDSRGENTIIVHSGANADLLSEHLDSVQNLFKKASVVLLQLECPLPTVKYAIQLANKYRTPVILNPSPWNSEILDWEVGIDTLIVNQSEACSLFGSSLNASHEKLPELAHIKIQTLILTQGARDTIIYEQEKKAFTVSPPNLQAVDTVGAGDTFAGAYAGAFIEEQQLIADIEFANNAASLSTLKIGAQKGIPSRKEIIEFMKGTTG